MNHAAPGAIAPLTKPLSVSFCRVLTCAKSAAADRVPPPSRAPCRRRRGRSQPDGRPGIHRDGGAVFQRSTPVRQCDSARIRSAHACGRVETPPSVLDVQLDAVAIFKFIGGRDEWSHRWIKSPQAWDRMACFCRICSSYVTCCHAHPPHRFRHRQGGSRRCGDERSTSIISASMRFDFRAVTRARTAITGATPGTNVTTPRRSADPAAAEVT